MAILGGYCAMNSGSNGIHYNGGFSHHRGPVTCVAAIPGTRKVVTSAYDSAVGLFDLDLETALLLGYHEHLVNRIVVNPAGTLAASSSSDYTIGLWDLEQGRLARVLRGHSDDVEDFAFVDETTGASVSRDWRILIWDLSTGAITRELVGHEKDVLSVVSFGGRLYTSGDDMTLRVWDLATGDLVQVWGPFETETDSCAVDPLRRRAVLGCDDGYLRIFDLDTGRLAAEIEAHSSGIKKVAVSPVTGDILSAAYDQRILVWDAADLHKKLRLEARLGTWERSFNWSPDGASVLAGTFDGTVLEWDANTGRCLREVGGKGGNACLNEVSADDRGEVVVVSDDGRVRLGRLSRSESEWTGTIEPRNGRVLMNAVTLDPVTALVACGAHDHTLHLFDQRGLTLCNERVVALGAGPINSIRVAHHAGYEGQAFVACYSGAIVRVDRHGEVLARICLHDGAVKALRIHPNQPLAASCSADGALISWTLDGRLHDRYLGHMAIVDDVAIDPSGTHLASVSRDFTLKVYGLADGRMSHSVSLGRRSPKSMCFLNSHTVIVGNYWGELIKYDLETERVTRRTIARNGISSVCTQGRDIVASSYDGALYLVDPEDLRTLRTLRAMVQRVIEPELVHA
jgi:toxoflavin biosynthesis protein ToxC